MREVSVRTLFMVPLALAWSAALPAQTPEEALAKVEALAKQATSGESARSELTVAYGDLYRLARELPARRDQDLLLEKADKVFRSCDLPRLAAQTWHDRAGFAGDDGDLKAMKRLYGRAIAQRKRLGDHTGIVWSENNTAYYYLRAERLRDALEPLEKAFEAVSSGTVTAPQAAVAINVEKALSLIERDEPSRRAVQWLWRMAECSASSRAPRTCAPDRLLRAALAADAAKSGAKGAVSAVRRLQRIAVHGVPQEVRADLALRSAATLLAAGDTDDAARDLEGLACGDGPAAPHLRARREVLLARVAAAKGDAAGYDRHAPEAATAFEEMGDRAGRLDALKHLTEAASSLDRSASRSGIEAAYEQLRLAGGPGGDGGSATREGKPVDLTAIGDHDAVFSVGFDGKKIVVTDLRRELSWRFDVRWKPLHVSRNGLGLALFGGYVKVRSMNYGGGAAAGGAPGQTTLDELGSYLPVPAQGSILVARNMAWSYAQN